MPVDANLRVANTVQSPSGDLHVSIESIVATYGASGVAVTPAATPTDIVTISGAAAISAIRIKKIIVSGLATTAGTMDVSLVKRTAVNTGGTSGAVTAAKYDSNDANPVAVVTQYSANATGLGTGVILADQKLNFGLAGAAGVIVFDFSTRNDKAIVLRGAAQSLALNLNGQAVPSGGTISYSIEWTEEAS